MPVTTQELRLLAPAGAVEASSVGSLSIWYWVIVGAVLLLVFGGRGKISAIMGDIGKGIRNLRSGLRELGSGDGSDAV